MTEVERLINSRVISKQFLSNEVISDFLVDEMRKKIWAIELDLLLKIDEVCKKYGLKYYLFWGSLLGAVRHKGFIPWDDDTDIVMPRSDDEALLLHQNEFRSPYFLQTPYSDKGYYYSHARLRNSNTSAIDSPFKYQGFNMGIFIDIQPIDKIDLGNNGAERFNEISKLNILNSVAMRISNPYLNERDQMRVKDYPGGDPLQRFETVQMLSQIDNGSKTDFVSIFAATTYGLNRDVFFYEDFKDSIMCDYCGFRFPIPSGYKRILSICYGNYMDLPPIEERGTWHSNISFNPDVSYINA